MTVYPGSSPALVSFAPASRRQEADHLDARPTACLPIANSFRSTSDILFNARSIALRSVEKVWFASWI